MCCDDLVCARCAQPVAHAGCPVCRTARAELHGTRPLPLAALAVAMAALLALAFLLATHA